MSFNLVLFYLNRGESEIFNFCCSFSKGLRQLRLGQAKARRQHFNMGLLCAWQRSNYSAITCCLPECPLTGRWNGTRSQDFKPGTPVWNGVMPSSVLAGVQNACPNYKLLQSGKYHCTIQMVYMKYMKSVAAT